MTQGSKATAERKPLLSGLVTKAHHTAVSVADFDAARNFFTDIIGMTLEGEMDHRDEAGLGQVVGLAGAKIRWALLELGGNRVELFHYYKPAGSAVQIRQCDHGLTHICFQVNDVEEAYRRIRQAGYGTLSAPVDLRGGATRPVYMVGPEGIIIELLELRR